MKKMMEQQEKEKEAADAGESIKEEAVQSYIASAKYSGSKAGFIFQKVRSSDPLQHGLTLRASAHRGRKVWVITRIRY